jgi:predicted amidohydrolase YtcJ
MTTSPLVITRARLWGAAPTRDAADLVDVSIGGGTVTEIAPTGTLSTLANASDADARVIDLDGRWLMPGLVDRHVHFTLWAKHRSRVSVAGLSSAAAAASVVSIALVELDDAGVGPTVPLVARGFQDALWPDVPTAAILDDAAARVGQLHRPVVLISHDLHSVWINTAAAARFGAEAGLLREEAAFDLEIALEAEEAADPRRVESLVAHAVGAASARGITGIMDLEMADNPAKWATRVTSGLKALRVEAGVYPQHLDKALARDERTGRRLPGTAGLVTVGPLKVFADGSLNTRTAWCFDAYPQTRDFGHSAHPRGDLARILADARDVGFEVALHAIGDRAVAEALDAFEQTGARGSIEHAQLVRDEDISRFVALGIAAGIHPEHALDDRAVTDKLWTGRTRRAFPYGALAAAGVQLRMGSDAPVAPLDPWVSISAAVHRTRDSLDPWEPANALTIDQALRSTWAAPAVRAGMLADLVAVDADPAGLGAIALREMPVALTLTAGRVTHEAGL